MLNSNVLQKSCQIKDKDFYKTHEQTQTYAKAYMKPWNRFLSPKFQLSLISKN